MDLSPNHLSPSEPPQASFHFGPRRRDRHWPPSNTHVCGILISTDRCYFWLANVCGSAGSVGLGRSFPTLICFKNALVHMCTESGEGPLQSDMQMLSFQRSKKGLLSFSVSIVVKTTSNCRFLSHFIFHLSFPFTSWPRFHSFYHISSSHGLQPPHLNVQRDWTLPGNKLLSFNQSKWPGSAIVRGRTLMQRDPFFNFSQRRTGCPSFEL